MRVAHIHPNVQNDTISVHLKFEKAQPRDARTGALANDRIETEKISQTVYVKYPLRSRAKAPPALCKLSADGKETERIRVTLGRSSKDSVQIEEGLRPDYQIVVSGMSAWERYDHVTRNWPQHSHSVEFFAFDWFAYRANAASCGQIELI